MCSIGRCALSSQADPSFYLAFKVTREETEGRLLYELGSGQWNILPLRKLLEEIIPRHTTIEEYEVEQSFPEIGRRTMLLNARKVFYEGNMQIPIEAGRVFRREAGQRSDLKPATIPN